MTIDVVRFEPSDRRLAGELRPGEVVRDAVVLSLDGNEASFVVTIEARPIRGFDANLVSGSPELVELLRTHTEELASLCQMAGDVRRGRFPRLPVTLIEGAGPTSMVAGR